MGDKTAIQWTDHTFNPWWGCTRVSPGCEHCYAETAAKRYGFKVWGVDAGRRTFGEKHWNEPRKWNASALKAGVRRRVFCASMADVFDKDAPPGELVRLWALIRETPNLDWQLLTKRPERIAESLPADWGQGYANVWLGCTVEDQERADQRIPILLAVPATVHFLSVEPQLGPVRLSRWMEVWGISEPSGKTNFADVGWVIVGGESGGGARPFDVGWMRSIVEECRAADVPVFCKQLGAKPFNSAPMDVKLAALSAGSPPEYLSFL